MGTRQSLNVLGTRCSGDATGHGFSFAAALLEVFFEHPGGPPGVVGPYVPEELRGTSGWFLNSLIEFRERSHGQSWTGGGTDVSYGYRRDSSGDSPSVPIFACRSHSGACTGPAHRGNQERDHE